MKLSKMVTGGEDFGRTYPGVKGSNRFDAKGFFGNVRYPCQYPSEMGTG